MFSVGRLINSFKYALEGLSYSFKYNQNIKIHIIIAFVVILVGLFLGLSKIELLTIAIMIVLVISSEMINTAIEEVINLLVNEHRQEAKIAKDVSAGMVLLVSVFALIVGFFVFLPHLIDLFR